MKRPIICLPAINWDYLFQRPQQLMLQFAKRGHRVYVVNPRPQTARQRTSSLPNLQICADLAEIPATIQAKAIYFLYYPLQATKILASKDKFIIYDCADDDPNFVAQEDLALSKADLVLCVSEQLMKKFATRHQQLLLLPNGVDWSHFAVKAALKDQRFEKREKQVILGFSGAFYGGWVDLALLKALVRARPEWQLVVVGEAYGQGAAWPESNVHFWGKQAYSELPAFIQSFSVGLIPFLDNPIATGADPIKLYEYLAAGIPVVSRRLPFTKGLAAPLVYTYDDLAECLAAVEAALLTGADSALQEQRRELARQSSWEQRRATLEENLKRVTWLED